MIAKYICLLAAVVVAVKSAPSVKSDRKCIPKQWEASVYGKTAQVNQGQGQVIEMVATISTDYSRKLKVLTESVYFEDKFVSNYSILTTGGQSYIIDTIKKTCNKLPAYELEQICSDSSSLKLLGSWSVGEMMTDTYELMLQDRKITITVLRDTFTLMSEVIELHFGAIPQMIALQYGNMTSGIADPSVFDIPSYC